MADPKLIYWDSDAFLAYLNGETEDNRLMRCEATLAQAKAGRIRIVTSALTLAEVIYLKGSPKIPFEQDQMIREFFLNDWIIIHNVDRQISEAARMFVWKHQVMPKDSIHVATALRAKAEVLETFDGPLITRSGKLGTPPITIAEPMNPLSVGLYEDYSEEGDDDGDATT